MMKKCSSYRLRKIYVIKVLQVLTPKVLQSLQVNWRKLTWKNLMGHNSQS